MKHKCATPYNDAFTIHLAALFPYTAGQTPPNSSNRHANFFNYSRFIQGNHQGIASFLFFAHSLVVKYVLLSAGHKALTTKAPPAHQM